MIGIGVGSLLVSAVGHHTSWSTVTRARLILPGPVPLSDQLRVPCCSNHGHRLPALSTTGRIHELTPVGGPTRRDSPWRSRRHRRRDAGASTAHPPGVARCRATSTSRPSGGWSTMPQPVCWAESHGIDSTLRSDARAIDAAYHAVIATAQPVGRTLLGRADEDIMRALRLTIGRSELQPQPRGRCGNLGPAVLPTPK